MEFIGNCNLEEISTEESVSIEGGIIVGVIAYAVNTALIAGSIAVVGATAAAAAQQGYDAMDSLLS